MNTNGEILRVLIVDNDADTLRILKSRLEECQYHVSTETEAIATMKLLQNEKQKKVDLIIIDSDMIEMDGCKLFENVASLDIPFLLMSSNVTKELVMKGIPYGACDFISKPARPYELRNIWRYAVGRRNESKTSKPKNPDSTRIESFQAPNKLPVVENDNYSRKAYGKRKYLTNEECDEKIKRAISLKDKRRRVVWSTDLHHKFIAVVDKLGLEHAVPKKILELMNDENLTRENVASHLQKYRLSLKKPSQPAKKTTSTSFGDSSNIADVQSLGGGVVNGVQNISNGRYVSRYIPYGVYSSPEVTRRGQSNTFMSVNDNIYSGFQMDKQNIFPGLPTPTVGFDCINQLYDASVPLVSTYPSNIEDFNQFHHEWPQTQSPLECPSNDSTDNKLTYTSGHFDACCANKNELYDLDSHRFGFMGYKTTVNSELLSDGSPFLGEDSNLLRGKNIDDHSQIINGGMQSNLKLQMHEDFYIPMKPP